MLDFDLANIYQVETKYLKRQVRRNMERFEGDDFMFEVTQEEILRCQNVTSSWGGSSRAPFCHLERSREISPCATLSRDDKEGECRDDKRGVIPSEVEGSPCHLD